jgi:Putative Ig domain/WD40-like Beta Propeller Repeat
MNLALWKPIGLNPAPDWKVALYKANQTAMHRNIMLWVIFLACTRPGLNAQTNFWDSPQAYLGQPLPGDIPVKFAPQIINDSPFFSMDRSAFSLDGRSFYYCRNNTWFSSKQASIQELKYDGSKWTGPTTLVQQRYGPSFSPGGDTIFLIGGQKGQVEQVHRTETGWTKPEVYLARSYGLYDFMATASGNMYAASNINGPVSDFTCYDICRMRPMASGDSTIHSLGKPINTPGFDGDFFIAPDESYMVVSAKEHPDYECELYISYHKKDGYWTNPKSLGSKINNGPAHRWGQYVTPNNKYLLFSYGHGPEDCALYWVRFDDLLEKLKHSNFDPYLKNPFPDQRVRAGKEFRITIPDDTFMDDDGNNTLSYTAGLTNGQTLPGWLLFHPATRTFSGKAPSAGTYHVAVIATDPAKASASCGFSIFVLD